MSRLPRRSIRIKPPLRGRVATQHYRGEFAPVAAVSRPLSPYKSGSLPTDRGMSAAPQKKVSMPVRPQLQPVSDGRRWRLFWKYRWLVVAILVLMGLTLLRVLL